MTLREPSIPEPTVTPVKTHVGAHVAIWLKIYFQGHEKQEKNLLNIFNSTLHIQRLIFWDS